ncbi:MAG: hypothetical protein LM567_04685 [Desulfurococcaceae archaeon]|nr:hypothetical protein [Desulfurococcaceae archaeon]
MYASRLFFNFATNTTLLPTTKDSPLNNTSTSSSILSWYLPLPATLLLLLIMALVISVVVITVELVRLKQEEHSIS